MAADKYCLFDTAFGLTGMTWRAWLDPAQRAFSGRRLRQLQQCRRTGRRLMSGAYGPLMRVSRKALQLCRVGLAGMAIVLLAAVASLAHPGIVRAQELSELSGVWQGAEITPLGLSSVEAIFFPNGTYSRAHVLGSLMTRDSGHFEVVSNWVHFYIQTWAPTEYLGRPLTWPTSDTWVVTRFNGRVLETANVHVVRVQ